MELPKNIAQFGEADSKYKVFVEDYVISYMKQLNGQAGTKNGYMALYGTGKQEGDKSYLFCYGAARLTSLQRETKHLSQAQRQEIEGIRKKHFPEYSFLGYGVLQGEMVDGFWIWDQDMLRFVAGYAQFYEKNDVMLSYMLGTRNQEVLPEEVDSSKYQEVKKRQEERKQQFENPVKHNESISREEKLQKLRSVAPKISGIERKNAEPSHGNSPMAAVFLLAIVCLTGYIVLQKGEQAEMITASVKRAVESVWEQKLPDSMESESSHADTIVADEKLVAKLRLENETMQEEQIDKATEEETSQEEMPEQVQEPMQEEMTEDAQEQTQEQMQNAETSMEVEPTGYIIRKGDTLIGISIREYGNDSAVSRICEMNQIQNPDDIKVGQKILLPY